MISINCKTLSFTYMYTNTDLSFFTIYIPTVQSFCCFLYLYLFCLFVFLSGFQTSDTPVPNHASSMHMEVVLVWRERAHNLLTIYYFVSLRKEREYNNAILRNEMEAQLQADCGGTG